MALCPTVHDKQNYTAYKKAQRAGRTDWSQDANVAFGDEHREKAARAQFIEEAAARAVMAAKAAPGGKR